MQTQGENLILKEIYWACFLSSCIYTYQIALPWLLAANTIPSCNIIIVVEIQVWYKRKLVYLSTDMIAFWFLICVCTLLVNTASKYVNSSANQYDAHPTPLIHYSPLPGFGHYRICYLNYNLWQFAFIDFCLVLPENQK